MATLARLATWPHIADIVVVSHRNGDPMMITVKECATLTGHAGRVWHCAWNTTGSLLASCGDDATIRLWGQEADKWCCKTILTEAHTRTIRTVAWSPCGNLLASASFDGTIAIWDRRSGQFECTASLEGHENEVKGVAWSKSGIYLASCSRDKSVWLWDMDEEEGEFTCASILQAHSQDVKRVAWHPNSDILISCSYDNKIKVFQEESDDWVCAATLSSHSSTVWSVAFDRTGDRIVSASEDKTVKVWQQFLPGNRHGIATEGTYPTWKCVCTLAGYHTRPIYDVAWCHVTDLIATASGDDSIRIFGRDDDHNSETNPSDAELNPRFEQKAVVTKAHGQDVNCVAWNPCVKENGLLASASDDGTVKLWSVFSNIS